MLEQLMNVGYSVTVLVRSKRKLGLSETEQLKIVEGDVLDTVVLRSVLQNQDAVIQCLGVGGKGDGKPNSIVSNATKAIVDVMEENVVSRLISMSNVGAGDSAASQPWIFKAIILPLFLKWLLPIIEDKNRMEEFIENSQLNWTNVRFPNITEKAKKGTFRVSKDGKSIGFSITNHDAASFLVSQLESSEFYQKSPSVSN